ncbi:MAG: flagellar assembly peptidoglycan hydrolase FlgJ [Thiobacillus sp.]|nr:flagellar assembly peptidoglycan hydrolase FlgJ [Thiobacillus sp.]
MMSAGFVPDRLAVDVADAQALRLKAANGDREALVGAARQFESLLVSQMLKAMRQTRFSDEDDPMSGGEGMKLYQDLLDQQWATQMAKGRGLGFADMMVKALEKHSAAVGGQSMAGGGLSATGVGQPGVGQPGVGQPLGASDAPAVGESGLVTSAPSPKASPGMQPPTANPDIKAGFIARMRPHAEAAAAATGVPADFILAHAALESGWGRHEIKDGAGKSSHNLFGIKAGRSWDGAVAETLTTEYRQGLPMKMTQRFRAYADYDSAFGDYANLLKTRYGDALEAGADASAFARGLVAGGYATDPAYGSKLQSVIARVAMSGV